MSDDPDSERLRERVAELEQTVEQQSETISKMLPSRRDLLTAGAGGLAGAGLLAAGSDRASAAPASADTSAGTVGVAGDSEDIVLDQAFDPGGDEILNVDDSGGINAQFGRTWHFNSLVTAGLNITGAGTIFQSGAVVWSVTFPLYQTTAGQFTNTQYERLALGYGLFDTGRVPDGATLYGRHYARFETPAGSDAVYARPEFRSADGSGSTGYSLNELEISDDADEQAEEVDSGWVELTSLPADEQVQFRSLETKVDGGGGNIPGDLWGLQFEVRID
jgi:hypothetical protein